jgi:hypothetical protein
LRARNHRAFPAFGGGKSGKLVVKEDALTKSLMILAAALSFGSAAAIAQTMEPAPATPPTAPTDAAPPAAVTPTAPAPAATDPGVTQPTGATDPTTQAPPTAMSATTTDAPPAADNLPTCSKKVTDKCVQKGSAKKSWKKK